MSRFLAARGWNLALFAMLLGPTFLPPNLDAQCRWMVLSLQPSPYFTVAARISALLVPYFAGAFGGFASGLAVLARGLSGLGVFGRDRSRVWQWNFGGGGCLSTMRQQLAVLDGFVYFNAFFNWIVGNRPSGP